MNIKYSFYQLYSEDGTNDDIQSDNKMTISTNSEKAHAMEELHLGDNVNNFASQQTQVNQHDATCTFALHHPSSERYARA